LFDEFHKPLLCPNLTPYIEKDYKKEWNKNGNNRICSNVKTTCVSKDSNFADGEKFFESSDGFHVLCPMCVKNLKKI
jgi:hypothetical protein